MNQKSRSTAACGWVKWMVLVSLSMSLSSMSLSCASKPETITPVSDGVVPGEGPTTSSTRPTQSLPGSAVTSCLPECFLSNEQCIVLIESIESGSESTEEQMSCPPECCKEANPNDRDRDRIPNDEDQCPDEPEDYDGFQDEDGCPDPDNDGDGIPDEQDLCPLDPETVNGFQDEDGCPDDANLREPDRTVYEEVKVPVAE